MDEESFLVLVPLWERKWTEEYEYPDERSKELVIDFIVYFKREWVQPELVRGWYQGAAPLCANTNNGFDFLSEYDSLYRPEGATLSVSEQLMVDAEEFLDQFEDRFLDKDVTSSKNKQRCILDPFRSVNRGFTARVTTLPTCFTEKHSVLEFAEIASKFFKR